MTVQTYLNHFELVAIAVEEGIISERLYRKWIRRDYVTIWKEAQPFVSHMRKKRNDHDEVYYAKFKELADRWRSSLIR